MPNTSVDRTRRVACSSPKTWNLSSHIQSHYVRLDALSRQDIFAYTTPVITDASDQLQCGTSTVHTYTQYTKIVSDKPIYGIARASLLELWYSDELVWSSDGYLCAAGQYRGGLYGLQARQFMARNSCGVSDEILDEPYFTLFWCILQENTFWAIGKRYFLVGLFCRRR